MQANPQDDIPHSGLGRIERQLERLDERTRNLATRDDLAALRKEVVQRDLLEPQLSMIRSQIAQNEAAANKRLEALEDEKTSRADRFWMRLGPAIAALAFLVALFQFFSHVHITP